MRTLTWQLPSDNPIIEQWYNGQYPRGYRYYRFNWHNLLKRFKKARSYILDFIPSKCSDCSVKMKRSQKILMSSASLVGVYYRGDGICQKCCDERLYKALES